MLDGQAGGDGVCLARLPPLTHPAESVLDAFKSNITNWPQFAASNNLVGWGADAAVPPCLYTGVTCDGEGNLQSL